MREEKGWGSDGGERMGKVWRRKDGDLMEEKGWGNYRGERLKGTVGGKSMGREESMEEKGWPRTDDFIKNEEKRLEKLG